jgi:hypothetical protein
MGPATLEQLSAHQTKHAAAALTALTVVVEAAAVV